MADIDVTFATNAPAVAAQVDQAAASTTRAAGAAKAHTVATQGQSKAIGLAIQAAKLHGTATKEEITALRIAQLEARKKEFALRGLAQQERMAAAAAAQNAAAQRSQGIALRQQELAVRQRGIQGAGALGAGRFAGAAQAILGKGAGIGEMIRMTAILGGVGVAIGMLAGVVMKWWGKMDEQIKAASDAGDAFAKARESNAQKGVGAAGSLGGALTRLTALGLRSEVGRMAGTPDKPGFGPADSAQAALSAASLFPGRESKALDLAATLAKTYGLELEKAMEGMKGHRLDPSSLPAVATKLLGRKVTGDDFAKAQANVGASTEVANFQKIIAAEINTDMNSLKLVAGAARDAFQRSVEAINEETELRLASIEAFKAMSGVAPYKPTNVPKDAVDLYIPGLASQ